MKRLTRGKKPTSEKMCEKMSRALSAELDDLFDITACKCELNVVPCGHREFRFRVEHSAGTFALSLSGTHSAKVSAAAGSTSDLFRSKPLGLAQNPVHEEELEAPENVANPGLLLEGLE